MGCAALNKQDLFSFPLPGRTRQESRVLRQLIVWTDEYLLQKEKPKISYIIPPTTEKFTKHFNTSHQDMLALLNRLERDGLVTKKRRISAGLEGNGYDGSLHSSVLPTVKAYELVAHNPK